MTWSHPFLTSATSPWTPGGTSGLMPSVPRRQAVQGLAFHIRVDPRSHAAFLPPLLESSPDHPAEALWLYAHHTATPLSEDYGDWHPERVSTTESLLGLVCEHDGVLGSYYNYNFCDTDWDLALMHYFGFPSKLAHFATTPVHPVHPSFDGLREGARLHSTVDRLGQRLVTARATLEERVELADTPLASILHSYGVRHVPDMDVAAGGRPLAFDLVTEEGYDHAYGELWRGSGELTFHEAENEEMHLLAPVEVLGVYHLQFAYTIRGVRVLHDYLSDSPSA
jgi:hypothetical protein